MDSGKFIEECKKTGEQSDVTEDVIRTLLRLWVAFQEGYQGNTLLEANQCLESLLICTGKIVFNPKYSKKISQTSKSEFKSVVQKCQSFLDEPSEDQNFFDGIASLSETPWMSSAFNDVILKKTILNASDTAADKLWKTEGWAMLDGRLDYLSRNIKAVDRFSQILHVVVTKGHQMHQIDPKSKFGDSALNPFMIPRSKYLEYLELYAILAYSKSIESQNIESWNGEILLHVIDCLYQKSQNPDGECTFAKFKGWKDAKNAAIFLARTATLKASKSEGSSMLRKFYEKWTQLYEDNSMKENGDSVPGNKTPFSEILEIAGGMHSTNDIYRMAASIFLNSDKEEAREYYMELFVRALTKDLNHIENVKATRPEEIEEIHRLQKTLSSRYLQLAVFFKEFPGTAKECCLTAFSLNIRQSLFCCLFPKSKEADSNSEEDDDPPELIEIREINFEIDDPNIEENLRLPSALCDDLGNVIHNPRYKGFFRWTSNQELEELCRKLLESKTVDAIDNKTLDYVELDYAKYKDFKPQYDPDDDGTEKGYTAKAFQMLQRKQNRIQDLQKKAIKVLKANQAAKQRKVIRSTTKSARVGPVSGPIPGKSSENLPDQSTSCSQNVEESTAAQPQPQSCSEEAPVSGESSSSSYPQSHVPDSNTSELWPSMQVGDGFPNDLLNENAVRLVVQQAFAKASLAVSNTSIPRRRRPASFENGRVPPQKKLKISKREPSNKDIKNMVDSPVKRPKGRPRKVDRIVKDNEVTQNNQGQLDQIQSELEVQESDDLTNSEEPQSITGDPDLKAEPPLDEELASVAETIPEPEPEVIRCGFQFVVRPLKEQKSNNSSNQQHSIAIPAKPARKRESTDMPSSEQLHNMSSTTANEVSNDRTSRSMLVGTPIPENPEIQSLPTKSVKPISDNPLETSTPSISTENKFPGRPITKTYSKSGKRKLVVVQSRWGMADTGSQNRCDNQESSTVTATSQCSDNFPLDPTAFTSDQEPANLKGGTGSSETADSFGKLHSQPIALNCNAISSISQPTSADQSENDALLGLPNAPTEEDQLVPQSVTENHSLISLSHAENQAGANIERETDTLRKESNDNTDLERPVEISAKEVVALPPNVPNNNDIALEMAEEVPQSKDRTLEENQASAQATTAITTNNSKDSAGLELLVDSNVIKLATEAEELSTSLVHNLSAMPEELSQFTVPEETPKETGDEILPVTNSPEVFLENDGLDENTNLVTGKLDNLQASLKEESESSCNSLSNIKDNSPASDSCSSASLANEIDKSTSAKSEPRFRISLGHPFQMLQGLGIPFFSKKDPKSKPNTHKNSSKGKDSSNYDKSSSDTNTVPPLVKPGLDANMARSKNFQSNAVNTVSQMEDSAITVHGQTVESPVDLKSLDGKETIDTPAEGSQPQQLPEQDSQAQLYAVANDANFEPAAIQIHDKSDDFSNHSVETVEGITLASDPINININCGELTATPTAEQETARDLIEANPNVDDNERECAVREVLHDVMDQIPSSESSSSSSESDKLYKFLELFENVLTKPKAYDTYGQESQSDGFELVGESEAEDNTSENKNAVEEYDGESMMDNGSNVQSPLDDRSNFSPVPSNPTTSNPICDDVPDQDYMENTGLQQDTITSRCFNEDMEALCGKNLERIDENLRNELSESITNEICTNGQLEEYVASPEFINAQLSSEDETEPVRVVGSDDHEKLGTAVVSSNENLRNELSEPITNEICANEQLALSAASPEFINAQLSSEDETEPERVVGTDDQEQPETSMVSSNSNCMDDLEQLKTDTEGENTDLPSRSVEPSIEDREGEPINQSSVCRVNPIELEAVEADQDVDKINTGAESGNSNCSQSKSVENMNSNCIELICLESDESDNEELHLPISTHSSTAKSSGKDKDCDKSSSKSSRNKTPRPVTPVEALEKILQTVDRIRCSKLTKPLHKYQEVDIKVAPSVVKHIEQYGGGLRKLSACHIPLQRIADSELPVNARGTLKPLKRSSRIKYRHQVILLDSVNHSVLQNSNSNEDGEEGHEFSGPSSPEIEVIEEIPLNQRKKNAGPAKRVRCNPSSSSRNGLTIHAAIKEYGGASQRNMAVKRSGGPVLCNRDKKILISAPSETTALKPGFTKVTKTNPGKNCSASTLASHVNTSKPNRIQRDLGSPKLPRKRLKSSEDPDFDPNGIDSGDSSNDSRNSDEGKFPHDPPQQNYPVQLIDMSAASPEEVTVDEEDIDPLASDALSSDYTSQQTDFSNSGMLDRVPVPKIIEDSASSDEDSDKDDERLHNDVIQPVPESFLINLRGAENPVRSTTDDTCENVPDAVEHQITEKETEASISFEINRQIAVNEDNVILSNNLKFGDHPNPTQSFSFTENIVETPLQPCTFPEKIVENSMQPCTSPKTIGVNSMRFTFTENSEETPLQPCIFPMKIEEESEFRRLPEPESSDVIDPSVTLCRNQNISEHVTETANEDHDCQSPVTETYDDSIGTDTQNLNNIVELSDDDSNDDMDISTAISPLAVAHSVEESQGDPISNVDNDMDQRNLPDRMDSDSEPDNDPNDNMGKSAAFSPLAVTESQEDILDPIPNEDDDKDKSNSPERMDSDSKPDNDHDQNEEMSKSAAFSPLESQEDIRDPVPNEDDDKDKSNSSGRMDSDSKPDNDHDPNDEMSKSAAFSPLAATESQEDMLDPIPNEDDDRDTNNSPERINSDSEPDNEPNDDMGKPSAFSPLPVTESLEDLLDPIPNLEDDKDEMNSPEMMDSESEYEDAWETMKSSDAPHGTTPSPELPILHPASQDYQFEYDSNDEAPSLELYST